MYFLQVDLAVHPEVLITQQGHRALTQILQALHVVVVLQAAAQHQVEEAEVVCVHQEAADKSYEKTTRILAVGFSAD